MNRWTCSIPSLFGKGFPPSTQRLLEKGIKYCKEGYPLKGRDRQHTSPSLTPQQHRRVCVLQKTLSMFGIQSHLAHQNAVFATAIWCPRNPVGLIRFKRIFFYLNQSTELCQEQMELRYQKVRVQFSLKTKGEQIVNWAKCALPPLIYSTLFWQTLPFWKLAFFSHSSLGCNHKPIF